MNPEHIEQVKILESDVKELESRFDRHLEIYANNGKELAGVKVAIMNLTDLFNEFQKKIDELNKRAEPAITAIETAKNIRSGVIWIAGFIIASGTIITAIIMFKDWLKK